MGWVLLGGCVLILDEKDVVMILFPMLTDGGESIGLASILDGYPWIYLSQSMT